jgi:hypothetical protein
MARVGRQSAFCRQPGPARDNGLDGEIKEGILAAGECVGWNARAVQALVVAVNGRRSDLNRVLVAYVELAEMLRTVAIVPRHSAVAGGRAEFI